MVKHKSLKFNGRTGLWFLGEQGCGCQRKGAAAETGGDDETADCSAYLSLHHQLFGEQHGLVTERLSHLHASGRIPGAARTFDTWTDTTQL